MQIETTRFGVIEIAEDSILSMPDGMLGLNGFRRYVLLEDRSNTPFKWLQSVENPAMAFIVINPVVVFPDYDIDLTDEQADSLDLKDESEAIVLTTVTAAREDGSVTTNLLGPIVINSRTLQARQIILQDDRYCTKHAIAEKPFVEQDSVAARAA
ncbi:MAG TPA: flagellar assembly protein FliW [Armatimonadota bacterium]|nr:flagellar assembly protein FliW [Armatimonadota bacterium]